MLERKNFILGLSDLGAYTNGMHPSSRRALTQVYKTSQFQMQVFKQSDATRVDGVFIYFSGDHGFYVMPSGSTADAMADYTAKNFIFINFTALPNGGAVTGAPFWTLTPNHGALKFNAREIDVALNYLFSTIMTDPDFGGLFDSTTPVYLLGHSRGAGLVGFWAEQNSGSQKTTAHASKVRAIGCNSPAGGGGSGEKSAHMAIRGTYGAFQKSGVPMLATTGADDRTHLTRSEAERIRRELDPFANVEFRVVGGVGDGHRPFEGKYDQWLDAVVEFGAA